MEVNSEALAAALKMAGQNTQDLDKTLRVIKTVESIRRDGPTPTALLALLAQYDPRYAAMAALMRALGTANAEPTQNAKPDDSVQYNHF